MTCESLTYNFFITSWEPRERRPRFWGGAGEARAEQNGVARWRIQYATNFLRLTDCYRANSEMPAHPIRPSHTLFDSWTPPQQSYAVKKDFCASAENLSYHPILAEITCFHWKIHLVTT